MCFHCRYSYLENFKCSSWATRPAGRTLPRLGIWDIRQCDRNVLSVFLKVFFNRDLSYTYLIQIVRCFGFASFCNFSLSKVKIRFDRILGFCARILIAKVSGNYLQSRSTEPLFDYHP